MHSLRAPDVDVPPFETEKALSEWLRSRGLEHVLRVGMAALIADVEAALMPQFRSVSGRRRLVELLYVDGVARWAAEALPSPRMKTLLPLAAARWLAAEEAGVNEARS
ncbi:MAG TPA: hypothetical protein VEY30_14445, partial [Myxococcaceae bacterium]|nr:hypothetical protein [Myxococcaceae bacterium]